MTFSVRREEPGDERFLWDMLYEATCWRLDEPRPPREEALADPHIARHLRGWGRKGDAAVVAVADTGPVGAAWYRLFSPQEPGYGFIDAAVPELSLGVSPGYRGRGAGTALLEVLMQMAREREFAALSLSVEGDNPALRLYERLGFQKLFATGDSWTMHLVLR